MKATSGQESGLEIVDLSQDESITRIMNMLRSMAEATDPRDILTAYLTGWVKPFRGKISNHFHLLVRGLRPGRYRIFHSAEDLYAGQAVLLPSPVVGRQAKFSRVPWSMVRAWT